MTKQDICNLLIVRYDLSRSDAAKAIDGFAQIAAEALAAGNDVTIRGFGTFKVVDRKATQARDITRGKSITVPARRAVKFCPHKALKSSLRP